MSNVIAVTVFLASVWYLLAFWMAHARSHSAAYFFGQPAFGACLLLCTGSLLYLLAFFGVAFVHGDVTELHGGGERGSGSTRTSGTRGSTRGSNASGGPSATAAVGSGPFDVDADVVIVGAGTCGAALAAVLARDGKRVMLMTQVGVFRRECLVDWGTVIFFCWAGDGAIGSGAMMV